MSLFTVDIPDVIVKPGWMMGVGVGMVVGGAGGRLRAAALLGVLYVCLCLLVLLRVLYLKEMQLDRLTLLADDTQEMVGRLQQLDQQLTDELGLLEEAIPNLDY